MCQRLPSRAFFRNAAVKESPRISAPSPSGPVLLWARARPAPVTAERANSGKVCFQLRRALSAAAAKPRAVPPRSTSASFHNFVSVEPSLWCCWARTSSPACASPAIFLSLQPAGAPIIFRSGQQGHWGDPHAARGITKSDQMLAHGLDRRLRTVADGQLLHDVPHVGLNRLDAQPELVGNLLVAVPLDDQAQHVNLALRQRRLAANRPRQIRGRRDRKS